MRRYLLLGAIMVALLTNCSKFYAIEMGGATLKGFKLTGTSSAEIELEVSVDNPSGRAIYLDGVDGFLKKEGINFAQLSLVEADTIAARQVSVNSVKFKIDIVDPLSLLSMGLNLSKWDYSDFTLDVRGVVRTTKGGRRVVKFKGLPIDRVIDRL